jgi:hypothetical protein
VTQCAGRSCPPSPRCTACSWTRTPGGAQFGADGLIGRDVPIPGVSPQHAGRDGPHRGDRARNDGEHHQGERIPDLPGAPAGRKPHGPSNLWDYSQIWRHEPARKVSCNSAQSFESGTGLNGSQRRVTTPVRTRRGAGSRSG